MAEDAESWLKRSITKNEIADIVGLSRNWLFRKVHGNSELMKQLKAVNYDKRQRLMTARQCKVLVEYWGVVMPN